ncbi:hypothetical protein CDD83_11155 [Cordyceps sp. RAO-2017]|nr:hypothetical protein CDD83_11155 [Cordyceps sp. RAO-2017]
MALLRHSIAPLRAVRCARRPMALTRHFSLSSRLQGGGGHSDEPQYDPPGGWLWGIKPGEKPDPEGWEWIAYIMAGSVIATGVIYAFKPDTGLSAWALEEARRRLEAEGIIPDPSPNEPRDKE